MEHRSSFGFRRFVRCVLWFGGMGLLHSGCWATWSELKKEQHLREELGRQFQAYKQEQSRQERIFQQQYKKDMAQQAGVLAQIRMQSTQVQELIDKLQKQVQQGQGGVAEMLVTLQNLQAKFQASLGQIDELQKQMREILLKKPDKDQRYTELLKKYEELLKSQQALAEQAIPARMFASARDAFKKQDYDKALALFRQFTQRFGTHDLADNAYLYIGDILRQRNQFNAAIIEYDELVKRYPQGSEVPVALFRLGFLHYKLGLCTDGRKYFRRLMILRGRAPKLAEEAQTFYREHRRLCKGKSQRSRRRRVRARRSDED